MRTLQKHLSWLYLTVEQSGYFGEITKSKVLEFQRLRKVPGGDGSYGPLTRMALAARLERGR